MIDPVIDPLIDSPGKLFLGRDYDLAQSKALDAPFMLPMRDLTTHAVCLGMTGTGKTGLGICLLEETLLQGVPVIVIDPKGDLSNLASTQFKTSLAFRAGLQFLRECENPLRWQKQPA